MHTNWRTKRISSAINAIIRPSAKPISNIMSDQYTQQKDHSNVINVISLELIRDHWNIISSDTTKSGNSSVRFVLKDSRLKESVFRFFGSFYQKFVPIAKSTGRTSVKNCFEGVLSQHERRHNNIKRHACEYCDKRFHTAKDLREHTRTHTGEKLYKCDHCDYACVQRAI